VSDRPGEDIPVNELRAVRNKKSNGKECNKSLAIIFQPCKSNSCVGAMSDESAYEKLDA
jgi:hypothetical protein